MNHNKIATPDLPSQEQQAADFAQWENELATQLDAEHTTPTTDERTANVTSRVMSIDEQRGQLAPAPESSKTDADAALERLETITQEDAQEDEAYARNATYEATPVATPTSAPFARQENRTSRRPEATQPVAANAELPRTREELERFVQERIKQAMRAAGHALIAQEQPRASAVRESASSFPASRGRGGVEGSASVSEPIQEQEETNDSDKPTTLQRVTRYFVRAAERQNDRIQKRLQKKADRIQLKADRKKAKLNLKQDKLDLKREKIQSRVDAAQARLTQQRPAAAETSVANTETAARKEKTAAGIRHSVGNLMSSVGGSLDTMGHYSAAVENPHFPKQNASSETPAANTRDTKPGFVRRSAEKVRDGIRKNLDQDTVARNAWRTQPTQSEQVPRINNDQQPALFDNTGAPTKEALPDTEKGKDA